MLIDRSNVFEIINKSNAKPDKDYGQNFLVEPDICKKIIDALEINDNDYTLEVGPGLGSLTHFINETNCRFDVVDIDARMVAFLRIIYSDNKLQIIQNDIRKHDVSKYTKIVGNLPYNITTETIAYILSNGEKAEKMVFMCQTETLSHFIDVSGKEYGPISVLIHLLGDIKKIFTVKAGCFVPVPKCSSSVFVINMDNTKDKEEAFCVYKMCKNLFLNRRKTILNNLENYLKNKDLAVKVLSEVCLDSKTRPEEISPQQYTTLYHAIRDFI